VSNLSNWFSEGEEHARRSSLLNSDELLCFYYDDVTTAYEIFQRGVQVSSKYKIILNFFNKMSRTKGLGSLEMQLRMGGVYLGV